MRQKKISKSLHHSANKYAAEIFTNMSKTPVNMAVTDALKVNQPAKDQEKKRKRDDSDKTAPTTTTHPSKKQKEFKGRSNERRFNNKKGNKNNEHKYKYKTGRDDKKPGKDENGYQQPEREEALDESIGKMNEQILADYLMQKIRSHNKDLTAVEVSDMGVPVQAFLDTTSFEPARKLAQLPEFLKTFSSKKGAGLGNASEEKGSPHTLVIASAGLRAADLVRSLRAFHSKDAAVAKLFAKHIKIEEAKQFLERSRVSIGVGTPQRIIDLLNSGTLKTGHLERIVIDGSHIDQKKRGVFDMKEVFSPLLQLLARKDFRERYGPRDKSLKVLVY